MVEFFGKNIKVNDAYLSNSIHDQNYSIDDLLNKSISMAFIDQDVLNHAYILEIESILALDNLYDVSRTVLNLERKLVKLNKELSVSIEVPSLASFYLSLSPVFLQSFVESKELAEEEDLESHWLEAVRIALEEELTVWQEKFESQKI